MAYTTIKSAHKIRSLILEADKEAFSKAINAHFGDNANPTPERPPVWFYRRPRPSWERKQAMAMLPLMAGIEVEKLKTGGADVAASDAFAILSSSPAAAEYLATTAVEWFRECIVGWDNLKDEDGNAILFEVDPATNRISDACLDAIGMVADSVGAAIQKGQEASVEDLGKPISLSKSPSENSQPS